MILKESDFYKDVFRFGWGAKTAPNFFSNLFIHIGFPLVIGSRVYSYISFSF